MYRLGNIVASGGGGGSLPIAYLRNGHQVREGATNLNGDVEWYLANTTVFDYNVNGTTVMLDPDDQTQLLTNNDFGNTNRITNDKGAQNYTDVGGGLTSDGATANYAIDHLTGYGWYLPEFDNGSNSYNTNFTNIQSFEVTAFDATQYGSTDYGQFRMPTMMDICNIMVDDGVGGSHVLDGIESWSDDFHYIMNSSSATNVYFWRELITIFGSTQWGVRAAASALSTIGCIVLRNHY